MADQLTATSAGGPIHVAGQLSEEAKVEQAPVGSRTLADQLTPADGSFGAWLPEVIPPGDTAQLVARDWNGNTTNVQVSITPKLPPPPTRSLTYDANGNLTQMVTVSADALVSSTVKYE